MPLQSLDDIAIQYVKGVGPRRARLFEKVGVRTVEDAFWFLPWRYDDRLQVVPIANLVPGMKATICGSVEACRSHTTARQHLVVVTVRIRDETGVIDCVFFNQPYLSSTFATGVVVLATGNVASSSKGATACMMKGPEFEILESDAVTTEGCGRIIPIYHETHGLSSKQIRRVMQSMFQQYADRLREILPEKVRQQLGLPLLAEALPVVHQPNCDQSVALLNQQATIQHQRLAFEELLLLQVALAIKRQRQMVDTSGIAFSTDNPLVRQLKEVLPFSLTSAQERVVHEIARDMSYATCMNRLLQGDVGCGKTVVALYAIVMACGSGFQSVLMAPTEVLSEQHYLSLRPFLDALGLSCVFVKGGLADGERSKLLTAIQSGDAQVVIGTHALLQPNVCFKKLGLIIIDEQHKFGVKQRAVLREKAELAPDVLVMTATPIPRTLAMTWYGDLDVSVIDEFPPGKKTVVTKVFDDKHHEQAYQILREELQQGRQAYVVYPLVEPSEKVDLQAAIEAADRLRKEFAPFKIGVLHGRLSSREKQAVMSEFEQHQIDLLVATTIVEVGLDVHTATVMLIEHAERFGLAQLHQLRGRVGRGHHQGFCLLLHGLRHIPQSDPQLRLMTSIAGLRALHEDGRLESHETSAVNAGRRLAVFAQCNDGFVLAEEDLKIRGPGQVLGVRQWGELGFRVADMRRDMPFFEQARKIARDIVDRDPQLASPEYQNLKTMLLRKWGQALVLGSIG